MNLLRASVIVLVAILFLVSSAAPTQSQGIRHDFYLTWVGVIDNGEGGEGRPHGPLGNLHIEVWWPGCKKAHRVLPGPTKREFDDGDEMSYSDQFLGSTSGQHPICFRMKIWESDPGPFRKHDVLFDQWITVTNTGGLYHSQQQAASDAVGNARRRGGDQWAPSVWQGGIQPGIPKMFLRIEAR